VADSNESVVLGRLANRFSRCIVQMAPYRSDMYNNLELIARQDGLPGMRDRAVSSFAAFPLCQHEGDNGLLIYWSRG